MKKVWNGEFKINTIHIFTDTWVKSTDHFAIGITWAGSLQPAVIVLQNHRLIKYLWLTLPHQDTRIS